MAGNYYELKHDGQSVQYSPEELLNQIAGYLTSHEIAAGEEALCLALAAQLANSWPHVSAYQLIDIAFRTGVRYRLAAEKHHAVYHTAIEASTTTDPTRSTPIGNSGISD